MENTLSIYVEALHETWEMPDDLALKWNEYEKENPVGATNADQVHMNWFDTLSEADKARIAKHKPEA